MNNINVNFNDIIGKMKPMHAVNNGPVHKIDTEQKNSNPEGVELEYYIVDENHDLELFRTEIFTGDKYAPVITLPVQSSVLIKLKR